MSMLHALWKKVAMLPSRRLAIGPSLGSCALVYNMSVVNGYLSDTSSNISLSSTSKVGMLMDFNDRSVHTDFGQSGFGPVDVDL